MQVRIILLWIAFLMSTFLNVRVSGNRVLPTTYVWAWNHVLAADHCHKVWQRPQPALQCECFLKDIYSLNNDNFSAIIPGEAVFVPNFALADFVKHGLPQIRHPFILVTTWGDSGVQHAWLPTLDEQGARWHTHDSIIIKKLLSDKRLIHWFTINWDLPFHHKKVTIIPLGLNYHSEIVFASTQKTFADAVDQEAVLLDVVKQAKPTSERIKMAYADFHLRDNLSINPDLVMRCGYSRTSLRYQLEKLPIIFFQQVHLPRAELWARKAKFAFSISPHGNGLDCHRTWEDLILGCIVIVKTSPLDPLYEELPVVIVNDWSEITEENLAFWLAKYSDAFTNPSYREKLSAAYWLKKVSDKQRDWREQQAASLL